MPRIIFVSDLAVWSMGQGNGGPAFSQTLKKYVDEKWEVYLISDEISNQNIGYLEKENNIFIKPTIFKKWIQLYKVGCVFKILDHYFVAKKFSRKIKKIIDNSHQETILYAYEIYGVKACKEISQKYHIPFITRFQGTILSQYKNCLLNHIRLYPHFQALSQSADLIIMTDDGTKGLDVLKTLGNNSKTLFLRNGLDLLECNLDELKRETINTSNNECLFLTVSRLVRWKHVERAIDGFSEYYKLGLKGRLLIIGDGDQKEFLMHRAKHLGISEHVIFLGAIAHDNIYKYMLKCDVFLSLYELSNVGNPLLEAMTLGKCIITLDVGDTCKVIKHLENGILLTRDELPTLGEKMAQLATLPELRLELGRAAQKYALKNFYSWEMRMDIEYREVCRVIKNNVSIYE